MDPHVWQSLNPPPQRASGVDTEKRPLQTQIPHGEAGERQGAKASPEAVEPAEPNDGDPLNDFPAFADQCLRRLRAGRQEYGDMSFDQHPVDLIAEIQEELQDTANWSFILWRKLERIRRALDDVAR